MRAVALYGFSWGEHDHASARFDTTSPYADYVTTQRFLLSHLVASIAGAGFAVVGGVAMLVLTARFAPSVAGWGISL